MTDLPRYCPEEDLVTEIDPATGAQRRVCRSAEGAAGEGESVFDRQLRRLREQRQLNEERLGLRNIREEMYPRPEESEWSQYFKGRGLEARKARDEHSRRMNQLRDVLRLMEGEQPETSVAPYEEPEFAQAGVAPMAAVTGALPGLNRMIQQQVGAATRAAGGLRGTPLGEAAGRAGAAAGEELSRLAMETLGGFATGEAERRARAREGAKNRAFEAWQTTQRLENQQADDRMTRLMQLLEYF